MKNKYWGFGIGENKYYVEWLKIFESKEKNVKLLYSIIKDDSVDEEDFSIGCQAIVNYVIKNSLWISSELFFDLVIGIRENTKNLLSWFMSSEDILNVCPKDCIEDWAEKRKMVLNDCIEDFKCWPKVVDSNFNSMNSLNVIIEKQLALGIDIKNILSGLFLNFKDIAKCQYKVFPNIGIPTDFSNKLEDILISLKELERKGVDVDYVIQKVVSLLGVKKWLI